MCIRDRNDIIRYLPLDYPSPSLYVAIEAVDKKDEDKIFSGLTRLREEDPSFVVERNDETHQTLLGGQGEMQLNIVMAKLKDRFGVEVKTVPQKIAYRETIKGTSDVQGKHKKQSGGAGQYGDVHIRFSPSQEEFEFSEELFGGSIPKNYVPAVEKGLKESMEKGPLAGCKVVNIKAVLYDGSYHDVDSNEMAFKIAASLAFKKGIAEAKPVSYTHLDVYKRQAHARPAGTFLAASSMPVRHSSFTALALAPGALNTTIPCFAHLSSGMLFTPAPALPTASRLSESSISCMS